MNSDTSSPTQPRTTSTTCSFSENQHDAYRHIQSLRARKKSWGFLCASTKGCACLPTTTTETLLSVLRLQGCALTHAQSNNEIKFRNTTIAIAATAHFCGSPRLPARSLDRVIQSSPQAGEPRITFFLSTEKRLFFRETLSNQSKNSRSLVAAQGGGL